MSSCCAIIIDNREGLEPIISAHEQFIPKDWPVYWIKNEETTTAYEYNKLLTSKRLWRNLADKVLIFQSDSMLLKGGIEDFLEWDFCGANIKNIPACMNGGLSIRDTKAMLKVLNNKNWNPSLGNEDIFYVNALRELNGHLPSKEIANQFSVETEYHLGSVGYHAISKYLTPSECNAIMIQYL